MSGTVSNNADRREDFEGTPSFTSIGGGAGAGKELVTFFQGAASGSRKVTATTPAGFYVDDLNSPRGIRSNPGIPSPSFFHGIHQVYHRVLMMKYFLSDGQDLNANGLLGAIGVVGNRQFTMLADDGTLPHRFISTYPATRSWIITPWAISNFFDPESDGVLTGAASGVIYSVESDTGVLGSGIDEFGIKAGLATGAAKSENLFLDSLDYSDGLWLIGGTKSPDAPAILQDLVDYDADTIGNRFGHITSIEDILYFYGNLVIGRTSPLNSPADTPTATYFNDSNKVIVFPEHRALPGWSHIEIDLNDPATEIEFNNFVMKGLGQAIRTFEFNARQVTESPEGDLDITAETINIPQDIADRYENGDIVEYLRHVDADGVIINLDPSTAGQGQDRFSYCAVQPAADPPLMRFYTFTSTGWTDAMDDLQVGDRLLGVGSPTPILGTLHFIRNSLDVRPDLRAINGRAVLV